MSQSIHPADRALRAAHVFSMRRWGLSYEQIAAYLRIPAEAVASLYRQHLAALA